MMYWQRAGNSIRLPRAGKWVGAGGHRFYVWDAEVTMQREGNKWRVTRRLVVLIFR